MPDVVCFVQMEFSHAVGVPAGLYPVHDGSVLSVAVTAPVDARRRRRRGVRSPRPSAPVTLLRVTHVRTDPVGTEEGSAERMLRRLRGDVALQDAWRGAAVAVLNVAIRSARAATGDGHLMEVTGDDPRAVRFGLGDAQEVHDGGFTDAFEVVPAKPGGSRAVELAVMGAAIADALMHRDAPYEAEELAQRALLDLEHGRPRAAAAQAAAAAAVLEEELRAAADAGGGPEAEAGVDGGSTEAPGGTDVHAGAPDAAEACDRGTAELATETLRRAAAERALRRGRGGAP